MGVNKAILVGHVGKDPEIVKTTKSKVARFSFATTKTYKDASGERKSDTTWHNIVIWGKLAEIAEKYVKKGSQLYLEGEISNRSYEKDGQTRYVSEVVVSLVEMLGAKNSEASPKVENKVSDNNQGNEDDLPF